MAPHPADAGAVSGEEVYETGIAARFVEGGF
jgi:hypothetical protein